MVMWRMKKFAHITNTLIPYFKQGSNDVFLYDVMDKAHTQCKVDIEIPYGCRTVSADR